MPDDFPAAVQGEFAIRNLSVLSYAQGFTLWHYKASGLPLADVRRPGFFDTLKPAGNDPGMVAEFDMILVSARDGGQMLFVASSREESGVIVEPLK